ncbi:divalent-cation tolerance protein CutA [Candidatus Thorarchaeota archaeon]|nr:MAG: divalent-cation tolerance protein CutA [Candidatus Thorarchaeota archaeon]
MKEYIIALTTCSESESHQLARILLDKQVCACVNIIPGVKSAYYWKKEIIMDSESILLIKTEAKFEDILKNAIIENHPYELPEFIVLDIKSGSKNYLDWISASLLNQ